MHQMPHFPGPSVELTMLPFDYGVYALDQGKLTPLFENSYGRNDEGRKQRQRFSSEVSIVVYQKWLGEPGQALGQSGFYEGARWTMSHKQDARCGKSGEGSSGNGGRVAAGRLQARRLYSVGVIKADFQFRSGNRGCRCLLGKACSRKTRTDGMPTSISGRFALNATITKNPRHWKRCVELKPHLAETHNNYGLVLSATGRVDDAIKQYQIAVELDGNQPASKRTMRTRSGWQNGLMKPSCNTTRLSRQSPENAAIYLDIGVTYYGMEKYDLAIDAFKKAIERYKPGYADAQKDLDRTKTRRDETTMEQTGALPSGTERQKSEQPATNDALSSSIQALRLKITQQQAIVKEGGEAQKTGTLLLKDIANLAVDMKSGSLKNQGLLDLLSANGVNLTVKGGPPINKASQYAVPKITPEPLPQIELPSDASENDKEQIQRLLNDEQETLKGSANAKNIEAGLKKLCIDLLDLSQTNTDARSLVDKYDLKRRCPNYRVSSGI